MAIRSKDSNWKDASNIHAFGKDLTKVYTGEGKLVWPDSVGTDTILLFDSSKLTDRKLTLNFQEMPERIKVNWGDGQSSTIEKNQSSIQHIYNASNEYTVTISAAKKSFPTFQKEGLIEVIQWGDILKAVDNMNNMPNLRKVANFTPIFSSKTDFTSFFENDKSLLDPQSDLFIECPNIITMSATFKSCSSIIYLDKGIFKNQSNVTDFSSCFENCRRLQAVSDIFSNCTNIITLKALFKDCTSLNTINAIVPKSIQGLTDISEIFCWCKQIAQMPYSFLYNNLGTITNISYSFDSTSISSLKYTGFMADMINVVDAEFAFQNTKITSLDYNILHSLSKLENADGMFSATPIKDIPSGFFKNKDKLKTCNYMFSNCSKLVTIPENLFETPSLKSCHHMFDECESIKKIPFIFNFVIPLEDASFMFRFNNSLENIHINLLSNLKKLKNCSSMFANCSQIQSVPFIFPSAGLSIELLSNMFVNCTSIKQIDAQIFSPFVSYQKIDDANHMFAGCTNLETNFEAIRSSGPYDWSRTGDITKWSGCFARCKSIPNYDYWVNQSSYMELFL